MSDGLSPGAALHSSAHDGNAESLRYHWEWHIMAHTSHGTFGDGHEMT